MYNVVFHARGRRSERASRTALALLLGLVLSTCAATGGPGGAEPYVAKGRVTDSRGNPLQGIEVYADNTAYYDMNVFAVTDADGYYRIELGDITPSSWRVGAYIELEYNGVDLMLALHSSDDAVFAGVTGAVRDLSWQVTGKTPRGHYGGLVYVYEDYGGDAFIDDLDLVELTFEPLGPLLDGSEGATTVRMLEGGRIDDLAVTRYSVSARYLAPEGEPIDLVIRERDTGDFAPSATTDFGNDGYGYLLMELQVRLP